MLVPWSRSLFSPFQLFPYVPWSVVSSQWSVVCGLWSDFRFQHFPPLASLTLDFRPPPPISAFCFLLSQFQLFPSSLVLPISTFCFPKALLWRLSPPHAEPPFAQKLGSASDTTARFPSLKWRHCWPNSTPSGGLNELDANPLAQGASHATSPQMIFEHYRACLAAVRRRQELATEQAGKACFAITPEATKALKAKLD